MTSHAQRSTGGFFAGLFDFGFTNFITLRFLRVIYTVLVVLICIAGLVFFIALISQGGGYIALAIVGAPLVTLLYLIIARVYLELVAMFFRIGQHTADIAEALTRPGDGNGFGRGPGHGSPVGPATPAAPSDAGYGTTNPTQPPTTEPEPGTGYAAPGTDTTPL